MIGQWVWNKKMETGVKEIDDQHIDLLDKINNYNNQISINIDTVEKTIEYLEKYILEHFQAEEELQRKYNFPEFEHHKDMHSLFISNIQKLKEQVCAHENSLLLYSDLSQLINEWLVEHIGMEDMRLAEYIKSCE